MLSTLQSFGHVLHSLIFFFTFHSLLLFIIPNFKSIIIIIINIRPFYFQLSPVNGFATSYFGGRHEVKLLFIVLCVFPGLEPSIDTDKLSYEIFSILESNFLFGYDDPKLWKPVDTGVQSMKNQRGKICILSIDGGGMRSILAGKALAYLENALKVKSGNPDARIADYFDVAAGTGVGGVFTAMLFGSRNDNRPIFKAEDTWKFLVENGNRFYRQKSGSGLLKRILRTGNGNGVKENTLGFETVMKEAFTVNGNGKSLTLRNTLKPVLIPCYDLSSSAPFLFSRADALESESFDFRLWEVCRATSALPGLFEPVSMKSVDGKTKCVAVDGGLAMSNPTAAAITHVLHNKHEFPFVRGVEDLLVVSLGSGGVLDEYNKVKGWKGKEWALPMARISGDSSADMVDHAVSLAFGQCRTTNYVRIQANGSSMKRCGVNIDSDCSPENIKLLTGIADEMLTQKNVESVLFEGKQIGEQTNFEKLDWFAGELVLEHQRRSCRIAPTVAFKQPS
ncbi:putative patatin-like phospholipase domain, Acyl transferase/acyl hydrolase/lysophospholipase [Helianthus annuus]|uniref:Patatin n=1 Tax=Helianthus annuus TaxID=4232 RepID=A0A9K3E539_HELAN|nr:putative patatin-like phospholipase domain, Acyl transferase/acyl hydrolase/lysophospholipase [Helianthus annuus]KAJ0833606.1 putative patatin-like phospholipase domain, Acyl transferase/acyl hydrolase/lysophospholipase [Helianthus annuus]